MKEDFLHYLWKHKKLEQTNIETTMGAAIDIVAPGSHNHLAGPDFFNARLRIDSQLWAGNVELHLKSSDWYVHGHEDDTAYDNVILHVVWEDDVTVFGKNNEALPTLVLRNYVEEALLASYKQLFDYNKDDFINCEADFSIVPLPLIENWLERIYLERLERKVEEIKTLLKDTKNDWEAVLFRMLARSFGTRINGQAFSDLAGSLSFKIIRKISRNKNALEALLLGHAGLLPETGDIQVEEWRKEYHYIKTKFNIKDYVGAPVQFFRLRPSNFPTLRLAQLARLYEKNGELFQKVIALKTIEELRELFSLQASTYWDIHYNFNKTHKKRSKKLSRSFIDLLLINTVIPIKFAYLQTKNTGDSNEILDLITKIPLEKNEIVKSYFQLKKMPKHALNSQALLQLKTTYCDPNKCLQCRIGNYLIGNREAT